MFSSSGVANAHARYLFGSFLLRHRQKRQGYFGRVISSWIIDLVNSISTEKMVHKTALVLLAEGAEEMEAVIAIDTLRRGGVKVTVGGVGGPGSVLCSRDVVLLPDMSLEEAVAKGPYDAVVLPGGMKGAENIAKSATAKTLLTEQEKSGRVIGAICAAPAVSLAGIGVGEGKKMTCYPSLKDKLIASGKHTFEDKKVVVDGQFVTSQGPGTAFDFGLALVEKLVDSEKRTATAKAMLLK